MNENIRQDDRYPEWMKAWNAKAAEIDAEIIDYCRDTTDQTAEAMDEIADKLLNWWDRQQLDPIAHAEYEKARADAKLFRAKVENRVTHLVQDGKIAWAKATRKQAPH
jgi:hypothetical protein